MPGEDRGIGGSNVLRDRRQTAAIQVVLQVPRASMHRPELMPHRGTLRRVLADDEVIDQVVSHPVAPVQRRVAQGRAEHVTTRDADPEPSPVLRQRVAQLGQQRAQVLTQEVAPRLDIFPVARHVGAMPGSEVGAGGLVEPEVVGVIGRARLRSETDEEPVELRGRDERQPPLDEGATRLGIGQ